MLFNKSFVTDCNGCHYRHAISPEDTRKKLPEFNFTAPMKGPTQIARRSDMDPNGHINNVIYLGWALEVVPEHVFQDYHLAEVEMDFKAECTAGDQVECLGMSLTESVNGNGHAQQFLHLLRKWDAEAQRHVEVWRARTTWKPKPLRASQVKKQ